MVTFKEGTNKFYLGDTEKNPKAEITYLESGNDKIIVNHTFVSDELRGQNIARQLVDKMVDFARQENKKIIPECSYVKKVLTENTEYEDVLFK